MMRRALLLANGRDQYTYTKPADATEENPYKVVKAYKGRRDRN